MIRRFPFGPLSGNASVRRLQPAFDPMGRLSKSNGFAEPMERTEEYRTCLALRVK